MTKTAVAAVAAFVMAVTFAMPGTALAQAGKDQATKVQIVKLSFDDKGYVVTPSTVT